MDWLQIPRILLALMLAAAAALAPAGPAAALPIHSAGVFADGAPGDTGQNQAVDAIQVFTQGPATEAAARSSGALRGHAQADSAPTNALTSTSRQAGGQARGVYDDINITGPAATVQSTLHVPFHGVFIDRREVWFGDFDFHSDVQGNAFFTAGLSTAPGGRGQVEIRFDAFEHTQDVIPFVVFRNQSGDSPTVSASTAYSVVLSDFVQELTCGNACTFFGLTGLEVVGFSGTIDLPGLFPTNTPLTLDIAMSFLLTADSGFLAGAGGTIDVENTFGVPQDGSPVFDLPEGFTANSVSLGIVNNVVPAPENPDDTPSSAAPAPGSLALLGLGGLAAALARLRRRAGRAT